MTIVKMRKHPFCICVLFISQGVWAEEMDHQHMMMQEHKMHPSEQEMAHQGHEIKSHSKAQASHSSGHTLVHQELHAQHQIQQQSKSNQQHAVTDAVALQANESSHLMHDQSHLKEHGGQIFQASRLETKWLNSGRGQGELKTEFESRIGTDENKLYLQIHSNKPESTSTSTDAKVLYSRNIATYWDAQVGVRYKDIPEHGAEHIADRDRFDAVFGIQGLAPYFFETELYAFMGNDDRYSLSLETERDVLPTQKLILKPYLDAFAVISDHSKYPKQSGLSEWSLGLETRYEINKRLMPFLDLSYRYEKGNAETQWQVASSSEYGWHYGAGIRVRF